MSIKKKRFLNRLRIPSWARNKYLIAITAFFLWMLFFDRNNIIAQVQLRMKLSDCHDKKDYYSEQIAEVKKEKNELLTSPDSLEKFARERYMMKKDNEDLFVIVPEKKK